jgi:hypothetical protein
MIDNELNKIFTYNIYIEYLHTKYYNTILVFIAK